MADTSFKQTIVFEVDVKDVNAAYAAMQAKTASAATDAAHKFEKAGATQKAAIQESVDTTEKLKDTMAVAAAGMGAVIAGAVALGGAFKVAWDWASKLAGEMDRERAIMSLGVDERTIIGIQNALGRTIERSRVLKSVLPAAEVGIVGQSLVDMGRAAAFAGKQLGVAKADMLGMVAAGSATDAQLRAVGSSTEALEVHMNRLAQARGPLGVAEEKAARIKFFIDQARIASGKWTANTKQTADSFKATEARIAEALKTLQKNLLPIMLKIAEAAERFSNAISQGNHQTQMATNSLRRQLSMQANATQVLFLQQRIVNDNRKKWKDVTAAFGAQAKDSKKINAAWTDLVREAYEYSGLLKRIRNAEKDGYKAESDKRLWLLKQRQVGAKIEFQERLDDFRKISGLEAASRRKALAGAKAIGKVVKTVSIWTRLISERNKGLADEARQAILGHKDAVLDLLSNVGGPIAQVFSAMRAYEQKAQQFAALFGKRFVASVTKLTLDQIKAQREAGRLTSTQAKAAIQLNLARKGGLLDLKEYTRTELIALEQQRAGLVTSNAQRALIDARVNRLEVEKEITTILLQMDNARKTKTGESLRQLEKFIGIYRKIGVERTKLAKIQERIAQIAAGTEGREATEKQREAALSLQLALAQQLKSAQGIGAAETVRLTRQAQSLAIAQAALKIEVLKAQIADAQQRFAVTGNQAELAKISLLMTQWAWQGRILDAQKKQAKQNTAMLHLQTTGLENIRSATAEGLTGFFESLFTTGDPAEAAKAALTTVMQAVGTSIIGMGTQVLMAGIGSTAVPALAPMFGGPAAIATGAGMIAIGAAIKAAGAAWQGSGGGAAAGGTASASPAQAPAANAPPQQQSRQQTIIINMTDLLNDEPPNRRAERAARFLNAQGFNLARAR